MGNQGFGEGNNKNWLVVSTPLKNMKVSWDDDIPNIWKALKAYKSHEHVVTSESLPEKLKRIRVSMPRKQPFFTLREHNSFSNNTKLGSGIPWLDLGHIIGA